MKHCFTTKTLQPLCGALSLILSQNLACIGAGCCRQAFTPNCTQHCKRVAYHGTPSLALAITDREHVVHFALYGYADLATQTPLTPDHLFQIGSISKSFTALAVLQQYDQGHIDLLAPITTYLPWFAVR